MAAQKRGDCIRFRVKLIPKEMCHDSHNLLVTLDPFWAVINVSDYSTISQVKKLILTRLNILAKTKRLQFSHSNCISESTGQANNNQIICTNSLKPLIEFQSCHLSMEDCFIPSSESSVVIRDGDLISVKAKCNMYYESKKENSDENHLKTSVTRTEKKDTNADCGSKNSENVSLKSNKKRKHTKDKDKFRKSVEKKNDPIIDSPQKKIKLSDDISGPFKSESANIPAGGQRSFIVDKELSHENIEHQSTINKDIEKLSISHLPNPHSNKEYTLKKSSLDIAIKTDKTSIISDGNTNTAVKKKCLDNSVKKVKDKDSRSLSALIHNLQLQIAEEVVVSNSPETLLDKSEDNTLSNSECKQNSKRKRVRKRKEKKKSQCNIDEGLKSVNRSSQLNLLKNDGPLNKHIKFDDCDDTYEVDKSLDITTDKNQQPLEEENTLKNTVGKESPFPNNDVKDSNSDPTISPGRNKIIGISENCSSGYSKDQCTVKSNIGSPIDPFNKFHQLLTQRNFTGREKEIMHSDAGHYVYHSHRKKKNDLASAADPNSDVLINVSTVVEPSKEKASKKGVNIESNKENSALLNTDHSFNEANGDKHQCLQKIQLGDFIAFKIIELSDNYNPVVSNLKEAKVLYVDKESGLLELELIGTVTKRKLGKFDFGDDEEMDNIVTHNIAELMEIKLMSAVAPK